MMFPDLINKSPSVYLMRHGERPSIPLGKFGTHLRLTSRGKELTRKFGKEVTNYVTHIKTSPALRCVETAMILKECAEETIILEQDKLLGDPGVYIEDSKLAGSLFLTKSSQEVARILLENPVVPGFRNIKLATQKLLNDITSTIKKHKGLSVFVTHDYIICVLLSVLIKKKCVQSYWPDFLEGIAFWEERGALNLFYKGTGIEMLKL